MEFDGVFTIEDVSSEEVWLTLSDPVMIKQVLPGCRFLTEVDDPDDVDFDGLEAGAATEDLPVLPEADPETVADRAFEKGAYYAALIELSVGSVNPRFETVVLIEERAFPSIAARGEGSASNSSFEMSSEMRLEGTETGVDVSWRAEADVFGRIAQMGSRMINPVANRVVNRFFGRVEDQLQAVSDDGGGLRERIRSVI